MALKYKVTIGLLLLSCLFGFGGYFIDIPIAMVVGFFIFLLSFSTLFFSDRKDTSIFSIIGDGLLGFFAR